MASLEGRARSKSERPCSFALAVHFFAPGPPRLEHQQLCERSLTSDALVPARSCLLLCRFTNAHYGSSPSHYNRDAHLIAALQQGEDGRPRKRRRSEGATSIPEVDDEEAENERSYGEDDDDDTETTVTSPVARRLSVVSRQSQNIFKTAFSPTEATPLLRPTPLTTPAKAWRLEAKLLAKYSAPILGTHILEFSLMVSTVVSTGHLSTNSLAAASLASMTTNVTALSIIQGALTASNRKSPAYS